MQLFPESVSSELTPEQIFTKLVSLEVEAHLLHLETTSYAKHKALDELYSGIHGFRDTVSELIIGHSKRFMPIKGITLTTNKSAEDLATATMVFGKQLHDWAESKGWYDLVNVSDELQALGTKVRYLLTLS